MNPFQPVSLDFARGQAVSQELLNRSNSATPAVSSAAVNLDVFSFDRMSAADLHSRSNSATPSVVVVPVVW